MRHNRPTAREKTTNFQKCLTDAINEGLPCPDEQGLDEIVQARINEVAKAYPKATKAQLSSAKREFKLQMDGTHAKNQKAQIEKMLLAHAGH